MRKWYAFLWGMLVFIGLSLFSYSSVQAAESSPVIHYDVPIQSIHPTQADLGKVQMAYKLTTYLTDKNTLTEDYYADFNDDNGYKKGKYLSKDGKEKLQDKKKYKTTDLWESLKALVDTDESTPAVTVVIGPNKKYYAIDGHHGANSYLLVKAIAKSGSDKVNVTVVGDYSNLTGSAFWKKMAENNQYYPKAFNLKTHRYQTIDPDKLPKQMGSNGFINDPFRSLNYFLRKSAIDKDAISVPFAEFYWGEFLTETKAFDDLDFSSLSSYQTALDRANKILEKLIAGDQTYTHLFKRTITKQYGIKAQQLGLNSEFDAGEIADQKEKLTEAWKMVQKHAVLQTSNTSILKTSTNSKKPIITVKKRTIHYLLNRVPSENDFLQAIGAKVKAASLKTNWKRLSISKPGSYRVKLEAVNKKGIAANSVTVKLVIDSQKPILKLDNRVISWQQNKQLTEKIFLKKLGLHGKYVKRIQTDFKTKIDTSKLGRQYVTIQAFSATGESTSVRVCVQIKAKKAAQTQHLVTDKTVSKALVAHKKLPETGDNEDNTTLLGMISLFIGGSLFRVKNRMH